MIITTEVIDDETQHVVTAGSIVTVTISLTRKGLDVHLGSLGFGDSDDGEAEEKDADEIEDNIDDEEDENLDKELEEKEEEEEGSCLEEASTEEESQEAWQTIREAQAESEDQ